MTSPHGRRNGTLSGITKDQNWSIRSSLAYQTNPTYMANKFRDHINMTGIFI